MIDFETPKPITKQRYLLQTVAEEMMRPHSRYFDEHEHEIPWDYINFMHQDPNLNIAFFGLRYATSSFEDELNYDTHAVIQSETGWPNTRETSSNANVKASWSPVKEIITIFAGVDGDYQGNYNSKIAYENPFVNPDHDIQSSFQKLRFYGSLNDFN